MSKKSFKWKSKDGTLRTEMVKSTKKCDSRIIFKPVSGNTLIELKPGEFKVGTEYSRKRTLFTEEDMDLHISDLINGIIDDILSSYIPKKFPGYGDFDEECKEALHEELFDKISKFLGKDIELHWSSDFLLEIEKDKAKDEAKELESKGHKQWPVPGR